MDLIDLLLARQKKEKKYFKNPKKYAYLIKKEAEKMLKNVKVYLFGSVVKGNYTPNSDIDLLIVCDEFDPERKGEIKAKLLSTFDFFAPFEIHLVTKQTFKNWYKKFIKDEEILEIK